MHLIPTPVLQALHDYLLTRPMGEVEGLVLEIRKCRPSEQELKDAAEVTS